MKEEVKSKVDHPDYYSGNGVECIDAMLSAYGLQAVIEFCRCNAFKYQWRAGKKGSTAEDIAKAQWYQNKMLELQARIS